MAKIKHFFRKEKVYAECNDRGVSFKTWVNKEVEHFCCSNCGSEVNKASTFCSSCGEKFTGIADEKETSSCEICGSKFRQMKHETATCCPRCIGLLCGKYGVEIAKAFYDLGKRSKSKLDKTE